jgi:hypothetical protein
VNIQGTLGEDDEERLGRNVQEAFREHLVNIQGIFWEQTNP